MPKFPVAFRRKSTVQEDSTNGAIAEPSFRVLDRGDANVKSFDGGARMAAARSLAHRSKTSVSEFGTDDNLFAGMTNNRYVFQVFVAFELFFSFCFYYFYVECWTVHFGFGVNSVSILVTMSLSVCSLGSTTRVIDEGYFRRGLWACGRVADHLPGWDGTPPSLGVAD